MFRIRIYLINIVIAFISSLLVRCNKDDDEHSYIDRKIDFVWEYSKNNPSGFTIDIVTQEVPNEGIIVAYEATQNSYGKDGLSKVVRHSLDHCHIVGGWLNSTNNHYYFDSDTIFQESMLDDAIIWAKKNKQISVFVLSEQKEIPVEYSLNP